MTRSPALLLAATLSLAAVAIPNSAQAGDRNYRWGGPRVGCPGEPHMIQALDFLQQAYRASSPGSADYWLVRVEREVIHALNAPCSPAAQRHLRAALRRLRHAKQTHAAEDLDLVGRSLTAALTTAQRSFRPVRPGHGVPVPRPLPGHHAVPAPQPLPAPGYFPHGGFSIQGPRFGIRIGF